jgi:hypothetical protein
MLVYFDKYLIRKNFMKIKDIISESQQSLWGNDELPKIKDPGRNARLAAAGGIPRTYPKWDDGPTIQPLDPSSQPLDIDHKVAKKSKSMGRGEYPIDSYDEHNLVYKKNRLVLKTPALEFIQELKKQSEDPSTRSSAVNNGIHYFLFLAKVQSKYSATGIVTKTNDIQVRFALGVGATPPTNIRVINPTDDASKENMISELESSLNGVDGIKLTTDSAECSIIFNRGTTNQHRINVFWRIVDTVEGMGPNFVKKENRGAGGAGSLITDTQAPEQYYRWLAKNVYNSVKENYSWGFSRGGEGSPYDRYDSLITIGITPGGIKQQKEGRPAYREHVVPCDYINRMAIKQCQDLMKKNVHPSKIIRIIMELIHKNLAIVLCSSPRLDKNKKPIKDPKNPTEQEMVDEKYSTTMPPTWDGKNILARFTEYNIPVYSLKNNDNKGKQIAE